MKVMSTSVADDASAMTTLCFASAAERALCTLCAEVSGNSPWHRMVKGRCALSVTSINLCFVLELNFVGLKTRNHGCFFSNSRIVLVNKIIQRPNLLLKTWAY